MYPAASIIAFTALSGAGFGLMAWLGAGFGASSGRVALLQTGLAAALAGAGLLASLLHLGHPERFLKAFSQWRSSWLSREGLLAVASFAALGLHAALWLGAGLRLPASGLLVTGLALATVLATSMIYAQMRAVPRWHSPTVPAVFLLAAIAGGAVFAGVPAAPWLLLLFGAAQIADWQFGDRRFAAAATTLASATGLGDMGRLRLLEPPHTGPNYLTREMVHVIGRRHARKLRIITLTTAVLLPGAITFAADGALADGTAGALHLVGMLVSRWLFFAEAEHVVGLYYGRR